MKMIKKEKKWLVYFLQSDLIDYFPDCGWKHDDSHCCEVMKKKYQESDTYIINFMHHSKMVFVDSFDTKTEANNFLQDKLKVMFFIAGTKMKDSVIGIIGNSGVIKNDTESFIAKPK